nr:EOG090X03EV [Triops cancriformis]
MSPSEDPEDEPMILGPEMFGLKRVGDDRPAKAKPSGNSVVLNRRGTPARVRKKNRLFYDENVVMGPTTRSPRKSRAVSAPSSPVKRILPNTRANKAKTPPPAPKRTLKLRAAASSSTPTATSSTPASPATGTGPSSSPPPSLMSTRGSRKSNVPNVERSLTKVLGTRLRNLLKLPKAHKWVCYEWFYSNIDKVLFEGDNDFMVCLKESFPQLKTRSLTRVEWCAIRKLMGRPRRCSQAFFTEEREELARKRKNIRLLQQRKVTDLSAVTRDLPDEIPLPLSIGTKVTARLRHPQDGLFMGQVDAVDTSNNTYRISFDRQGIGTHSVPDYEVLSNETPDMISLTSLTQRFRPRPPSYLTSSSSSTLAFPSSPSNVTALSSVSLPFLSPIPPGQSHALASPLAKSIPGSPRPSLMSGDPLLGGSSPLNPRPPRLDGTLGEYPVAFLMKIVQLTKVLDNKKTKIALLREMNAEAEKRESFNEEIRSDFQRMYARVVLDLEGLNRQLNSLLLQVREHCQEVSFIGQFVRVLMLIVGYISEDSLGLILDIITDHNEGYLCLFSERKNVLGKDVVAILVLVHTTYHVPCVAALCILRMLLEDLPIRLVKLSNLVVLTRRNEDRKHDLSFDIGTAKLFHRKGINLFPNLENKKKLHIPGGRQILLTLFDFLYFFLTKSLKT